MQTSQLQPELLKAALESGDTFSNEQTIDAVNIALFEPETLSLHHGTTQQLLEIFELSSPEELQEAIKALDNHTAANLFDVMHIALSRDAVVIEEAYEKYQDNSEKRDLLGSMLLRNKSDRTTLGALNDASYLMEEIGNTKVDMRTLLDTAFALVEDNIVTEKSLSPSTELNNIQHEEKSKGRSKE